MDSLTNKSAELDALMPLIREQLLSGGRVTFSPRGTSMLPMIRQGQDTVTLSPLPERLKKYDLPLYRRENGQYVLHRVVRVSKDRYTCIGDNQFVFEHDLRHAQMIAVVSSFCRNGREVPANSTSYWLYCRFWHYSRPLRRLWRSGLNLLRRAWRYLRRRLGH